MDQWAVLIPDHHLGFIDWTAFQDNQARLDSNTRPQPYQAGGAVRESSALLQGLATCGHCGRRLHVHYRGRNSAPGDHCAGKDLVNGRGVYCLNVGGMVIEQAVANAFLEAVTPAAVEATMLSVQQLQANHDAALLQWRLEVERARYEAERAERRYRAVEPENRLVARGLETEWENRLRDLAAAETELRRREQQRPNPIGSEQLKRIQMLGSDIRQVWTASAITDRDRKELLRTLLEEVILNLQRAEGHAHLTLRWRGGAITVLDVPVPRFKPMGPRTDEDTISLLRRLAALYPDEVIAGILNRQGRKTATGERFTANQVGSLRRYRKYSRFQPPAEPPSGDLVSIRKAAQILGMNTSSIHRWLADGSIAGEQVTPGAPWQIRINDELRARIVQQTPPDYLPMLETTMKLGVSRQTGLVLFPCDAIHPRSSLTLQRIKAFPEQANSQVVKQSSELHLLPFPATFAHTRQSLGHAGLALCRVCAGLRSVLLDQRPPLLTLRRRFPAFVRMIHRYCSAVRLLEDVHAGRMAFAFTRRPVAKTRFRHLRGLPVLVYGVSRRAWGLRLRRADQQLAIFAADSCGLPQW
jgi:Recombinase zinc beta ribbon domain